MYVETTFCARWVVYTRHFQAAKFLQNTWTMVSLESPICKLDSIRLKIYRDGPTITVAFDEEIRP